MESSESDLDYIRDGIKAMIAGAENFEQRRKAIETAMKFEALRLKDRAARKPGFGKGFDPAGGEDDI